MLPTTICRSGRDMEKILGVSIPPRKHAWREAVDRLNAALLCHVNHYQHTWLKLVAYRVPARSILMT